MGWLIGLAGNTNREQAAGCAKAGGAPVSGRILRPPQRRRVGGWLATTAMVAAVSVVVVVGAPPAAAGPEIGVQVVDVREGSTFSNPSGLLAWNGRLYFSATDGQCNSSGVGRELWSVGPAGDLDLVKNINTAISGNCDGVSSVFDGQAAILPGAIVFEARDNPFISSPIGWEPWITDGTEAGTEVLKDIYVGDHSFPYGFTTVMGGTRVVFRAEHPVDGWEPEPYITDGTTAGTRRIADLAPGDYGSWPEQFTPLSASHFVFVADDYPTEPTHYGALWASNGSTLELVADIDPNETEEIDEIVHFAGKDLVILAANDGVTGIEPWVSDGTPEGTFPLADINTGAASSEPTGFVQVGDQMFFSAFEPATGRELWVTDGTPAGTRLVADIGGYFGDNIRARGAAYNGQLFFSGPGPDIWISDGTEEGTVPTGIGLPMFEPTVVNELLYFVSSGPAVWVTDGTLEGTEVVADEGFTVGPRDLTAVGNAMLGFVARNDTYGQEVWIITDQDGIGPNVAIGFGPIPIGVFEDGTLTATANDENTGGANIAGIEFQIDGGAWSPMPALDGAYDSVLETGIQIVSFATEGTHQACVRATDVLGNLGDAECMDIEVVAGDATPPEITQLEVQPNPVDVGETAVLSVQASDAATGNAQIVIIEYRVDGGPWESIIPPADGAYDESTEEGEVDLVFDTEGTHEVCVRAADAANNVSAPECVDVSAEGPVGLMVQCLHQPLYPQTGDEVVIRARALDRDGIAVQANRLEIYLNDRDTPFVFAEGSVHGTNARFTADGQQFFYGCRAERGDESAFSRFAGVDVGEPELSIFPAIPVLYHGPPQEKIDIVFLPDDDEYLSYTDPAFIDDVGLLIFEGFGTMPSFLENQHMFNFWIGIDSGNASPRPSNEKCFRQPPDHFSSKYAFADSAGIVHRSDCRDNAGSPGVFTIEMNLDRLQVVIHEAGHRPFGLADEYCCDGGYFTNSIIDTPPFANLFRRENGCRNDAEDRGFNPDDCRELFASGKNWWLFEPDYGDINPWPWDWMQQTGCAAYTNFNACSLLLDPEITGPDPDPNGLYACNELMDAYRVDTSGGTACVWNDPDMPCLWLCRSPGSEAEAEWVPSGGSFDRYEIGPSELDRFYWFLSKCAGGEC